MENFFNYLSKPIPFDEVDIWFKINNIIPEKLELFFDFIHSLNNLIQRTYLGNDKTTYETKITLSSEDNLNHFKWCWNKIIEDFKKEDIFFQKKGEHFDYFKTFFEDIYYNQKEEKIKSTLDTFFIELFDVKKPFTKSDLDMINVIYKIMDKSIKI